MPDRARNPAAEVKRRLSALGLLPGSVMRIFLALPCSDPKALESFQSLLLDFHSATNDLFSGKIKLCATVRELLIDCKHSGEPFEDKWTCVCVVNKAKEDVLTWR